MQASVCVNQGKLEHRACVWVQIFKSEVYQDQAQADGRRRDGLRRGRLMARCVLLNPFKCCCVTRWSRPPPGSLRRPAA